MNSSYLQRALVGPITTGKNTSFFINTFKAQPNMSWQDYITNNLEGSGHVAKALICGLDGTWWAGSDKFEPSADEIKKIISGFDDSGAQLRAEGMKIMGAKYLVLKADNESIYAKCGPGGAVACKCGSCVILATYVEKMTPGNCNKAAEALADYLRESGY